MKDNLDEKIENEIEDYIKPHTENIFIEKPVTEVKKPKKQRFTKKTGETDAIRFEPDLKKGLTDKQIEERKANNQVNVKGKQYSKSVADIIFSNLFTVFNLLCVGCVVALLFVNASFFNYTFVITYLFNVTIGIVQEIRAKQSIEKLSIMNEPTATVLRKGKFVTISVNDIVLDEIIKFSLGNQISADCTVVDGEIYVNESLLTGESNHIKKVKGDKLLSGSFVVGGTALAVADKVGEARYIQVLTAKAKKFNKPSSELLRSLQLIIRLVGILILPIGLGVLWTNYKVTMAAGASEFVANGTLTALGLREIVTRTTSVIIGMIPAGMLLLTTLALAVGVLRLAGKRTSVQDMYSLERLARVDVLCLDKTGTITDGRLKVSNCIIFDRTIPYNVNEIIASMQSSLNDNNQTSIALKEHFGREKKYIATKILPFNSEKKYSAVSFNLDENQSGTFVLGAPEFVLSKESLTQTVLGNVKHYASMGQRVLLLAYSPSEIIDDKIPDDLKAFALITLSDNVRKNVLKTLEWFKNNDVQIKVISGDNPITVAEVAKRAGIDGADKYISLEGLSDREVVTVADKYNIFGRVSPEQKAILVKALKSAGHTVGMVGDGVNDILAMKESNCSITVATGSDATKNIAHIVLMDSNFNTLPDVVAEGRRVINNIERSSSLYLMKTLFTLIFAITSILRSTVFPFNNQMMIMLEVVVIGIGSFALSMEKNTNRVDGKFMSYVIAHSIPGAAILIMNVFAFDILDKLPLDIVFPSGFKDTLMVAALSFGGLAYLYVICKPYNLYRTILVLSLSVFSIIWICFFMPAFNLPNLLSDFKHHWQYVVVLLCLIQFDVTVSKFLTFITEKIRSTWKVELPSVQI